VEKFPEVKRLGDEMRDRLSVYLVNVDDRERLDIAKKALVKYSLSYPTVWAGQGQDDPVWRLFGNLTGEGLFSIPLYVLIDPQNRTVLATGDVKNVRSAILQ
jgi:hypothetical protein